MAEGKGAFRVALGEATGGGGLMGEANPEGADLIVTRLIVNVTTEATGAANADFGIAADAVTTSDTLLDAVDIGAAAAIFGNFDDQGTNGQSVVLWPSDEFLTGTASADPADVVGYAYVEYIRV